MAKEIFVDASAWVALAHSQDNNHQAAKKIYPRLTQAYQRFVTTDLVIAEAHALLRYRMGHPLSLRFLESTRTSPRVERVFATSEFDAQAEAILRRYNDQAFSYADAVSFAVMKQRGIIDAFTYDHHFRVMGFRMIG